MSQIFIRAARFAARLRRPLEFGHFGRAALPRWAKTTGMIGERDRPGRRAARLAPHFPSLVAAMGLEARTAGGS